MTNLQIGSHISRDCHRENERDANPERSVEIRLCLNFALEEVCGRAGTRENRPQQPPRDVVGVHVEKLLVELHRPERQIELAVDDLLSKKVFRIRQNNHKDKIKVRI